MNLEKNWFDKLSAFWVAILMGTISTFFSYLINYLIVGQVPILAIILPAGIATPITYIGVKIGRKYGNIIEKQNIEIKLVNQNIYAKNEQLKVLSVKLSKYLSPQLYESIFSGEKEVRIATQSKRLTVFFSDIVSFTKKSEEMPENEFAKWLNNYLNIMANIVLRYEGTLDKFIGDAIMVFFGDPISAGEKKDALNCVMMAKEMNERAKAIGMEIRIGIASGTCIVGNFGSENRMDYTVVGRTVNIASRMETNSLPGKILISSNTYELIKNDIPCDYNGSIKVKGINDNLETYWVK